MTKTGKKKGSIPLSYITECYSLSIFMNIFDEYFHVNNFSPVLHQTHSSNYFRVTEILVVLSGDFRRYLTFTFIDTVDT